MADTKIKRAILWIRRSLEITERTNVPESIENVVRPKVDIFGWERLPSVQVAAASNPLSVAVGSATVPAGTFRYVLNANVEHTDTGVTNTLWLTKALLNGVRVGLPLDRTATIVGETASMIGTTYLLPGDFLFGETDVAVVAGAMILNMLFVDFDFDTEAGIGEYIVGH